MSLSLTQLGVLFEARALRECALGWLRLSNCNALLIPVHVPDYIRHMCRCLCQVQAVSHGKAGVP